MNITQQLCCPGAAENQDYIRWERTSPWWWTAPHRW